MTNPRQLAEDVLNAQVPVATSDVRSLARELLSALDRADNMEKAAAEMSADVSALGHELEAAETRAKRLQIAALEQNDEWARKCGIYEEALRRLGDEDAWSMRQPPWVVAREALAAAEETKP